MIPAWVAGLLGIVLQILKGLFGLDKPREEKVNEAMDPDAPGSGVFARPERLRDFLGTPGRPGNDLGKNGDTSSDRGRPEV